METPPDLDEVGWTRVPQLLTTDEVEEILDRCDALFLAPADERSARDKPAAGTRHLNELDQRIPLVGDLVGRSPLLDPVRSLIGPDPLLTQAGLRSPQPGFGRQSLHTDDVPKLDAGRDAVATAIIALVELTPQNGATRIVPKSHRRPDLQRRCIQGLPNHEDELVLTGAAGTAFVFSGHLLHGGGENDSTKDRPVLQLCWRATSR